MEEGLGSDLLGQDRQDCKIQGKIQVVKWGVKNTGPVLASSICYFCDLGQIVLYHGHSSHAPCVCQAWDMRLGCWQLGNCSHPGCKVLRASPS